MEMRTERDHIGEVSIATDALYGIHARRARDNFPGRDPFPVEWFRATGLVKAACYRTLRSFLEALEKEHPDLVDRLRLPGGEKIDALETAAAEVSAGDHFEYFIVPAEQGGAGTSINLNINEIITNVALKRLGRQPGDYHELDPIEHANMYQSTNDVIPTALTVAALKLLEELEEAVNGTRARTEELETRHRNVLRLGYTQMEEAVPSTYGQLFSTYSDALSRDWWRISKVFERIKTVNLGGGATGTGVSLPRYYIMHVVRNLKELTHLPVTQAENLPDATANMDRWVEAHAILKAHAVNLEKMASDLRLLSSGVSGEREITLPARQVGSSIMPGKVNPVITEYIVSSARRILANDQKIASLSGAGCLELNPYLPGIGCALLDSLKLLIATNHAFRSHMLAGLEVHEKVAGRKLFRSPAVTTALSPLLGYHRASALAREMGRTGEDIFRVNERLQVVNGTMLKEWMTPGNLLKQGFTMDDIRKWP